MTLRQHPKVSDLKQRLEEARACGDDALQREALAQLRRIELRELSAEQLAAQAQYIVGQCEQEPRRRR